MNNLPEFEHRIEELRTLQAGWMTDEEGPYGSPPDQGALTEIEVLVRAGKFEVPYVYVDEDGQVSLEWDDSKGRVIRAEFSGQSVTVKFFPPYRPSIPCQIHELGLVLGQIME